jgi:hypothetical protein
MHRWIEVSTIAACLLAVSGLGAGLESQQSFAATLGAKRLKIVHDTDPVSTMSGSFTMLKSTTITIPPSWTTGRLVARFSGESRCAGAAGGVCSIRLLVNGEQMLPKAGGDYAFDSTGGIWLEASSVERLSLALAPGTYTVAVQGAVLNGATSFSIDDYALTVILWRVS